MGLVFQVARVLALAALLGAASAKAAKEGRAEKWRQREESAEASAKAFLSLLALDDGGMREHGTFGCKPFREVARLAKEGKASELCYAGFLGPVRVLVEQ